MGMLKGPALAGLGEGLESGGNFIQLQSQLKQKQAIEKANLAHQQVLEKLAVDKAADEQQAAQDAHQTFLDNQTKTQQQKVKDTEAAMGVNGSSSDPAVIRLLQGQQNVQNNPAVSVTDPSVSQGITQAPGTPVSPLAIPLVPGSSAAANTPGPAVAPADANTTGPAAAPDSASSPLAIRMAPPTSLGGTPLPQTQTQITPASVQYMGTPDEQKTIAANKALAAQLRTLYPNNPAMEAAAQAFETSTKPVDPTQVATMLKPQKETDREQDLDALARSMGLKDHSQLSIQQIETYDANKAKQAANIQIQTHAANRDYDVAHPTKDDTPDQAKLEQQYRTVLQRAMSSRSGGVGLEDAKVQQANHLLALLDQNYDPKSGTYNLAPVLQNELALGLARLTSPSGQVGEGLMNELNQASAQGDVAKMYTYVTGTPVNGTPQAILQMFKDSIQRQGQVAQTNREGEMQYLRGLAPTDLEESRRQSLEANSLNPLRMSKVQQNPQTGDRRLVVSTDGGKTWNVQ